MSDPQHVYTSDGHRGVIVGEASPSRDDPRFLDVLMDDGTRLHVPAELLELRPDGAFNLLVGYAELEGQQTTASGRDRPVGDGSAAAAGPRRFVLPVIVEELEVGRRAVTTGVVRVQKRVHEREELVDETVTREDVYVERVPVGRMVDAAPAMRNEGDTLVIPVLEEVLVVERRLRLKEEVRVTWRRVVEPAPQRVVLRDEEVIVERQRPPQGAGEPPAASA